MIKVIIVEDDINIAALHKRFLEKFSGFEVIAITTNVKDSIDAIKELIPDLVLLDLYLKDGYGLDILSKIREMDLDVDFIIISAAKDIVTIKNAMHKGVFDYLIKPIIFDRLKESIDKYAVYSNSIKNRVVCEQDDIDLIKFSSSQNNTQNNIQNINKLPKGIDPITLNKILEILENSSTPVAAEEIGNRIGASRNTARRYLEYLTDIKIAKADINYGRVGRPEKEFILVSKMSKK